MKKVVLIGGGGHASDVLAVIEEFVDDSTVRVIGILDDGTPNLGRYAGREVQHIGKIGEHEAASHFVWGLGWPSTRRAVLPRLSGLSPLTVVHRSAVVHNNVRMGEGCVIMAGAIVSAGAVLGDHVLVHHNAIVGHDCKIGDFVSIMPGAVVSGDTRLEAGCLVGAGALIKENTTVGEWATVGMGAVSIYDVPPLSVVVGNPARPLGS